MSGRTQRNAVVWTNVNRFFSVEFSSGSNSWKKFPKTFYLKCLHLALHSLEVMGNVTLTSIILELMHFSLPIVNSA